MKKESILSLGLALTLVLTSGCQIKNNNEKEEVKETEEVIEEVMPTIEPTPTPDVFYQNNDFATVLKDTNLYDEYGNGKRYYYAKDFNLNDAITRNVKQKNTCKDFYEIYKKLLFEEKIDILCRYIEKYNRKPPELLGYLFNKDNQQPS